MIIKRELRVLITGSGDDESVNSNSLSESVPVGMENLVRGLMGRLGRGRGFLIRLEDDSVWVLSEEDGGDGGDGAGGGGGGGAGGV